MLSVYEPKDYRTTEVPQNAVVKVFQFGAKKEKKKKKEEKKSNHKTPACWSLIIRPINRVSVSLGFFTFVLLVCEKLAESQKKLVATPGSHG